ncbi:transcription factor [Salix suchowensis]|nr:transcription factor [Salix suchowensis]
MSDGRVGYRFHPTDEEIISYFLKHKMDGSDSSVDDDIPEIDLCKFEPWDLPKYAAMEEPSNDQVLYFFCPRDCKYPNSQRVNRTTKAGYWKSTGRDRKIKARRTKKEIGTKKTLVFHEGRVPDGIKTNWIIHEYRSQTILPHQRAFTVCKLKEKGDGNTDTQACDEGETSNKRPTNLGNPVESPIQQPVQTAELKVAIYNSCPVMGMIKTSFQRNNNNNNNNCYK